MTEKIKKALVVWAEKIIKNESQWDSEHVHQAIQKLYELSVCQKFLMEAGNWGVLSVPSGRKISKCR